MGRYSSDSDSGGRSTSKKSKRSRRRSRSSSSDYRRSRNSKRRSRSRSASSRRSRSYDRSRRSSSYESRRRRRRSRSNDSYRSRRSTRRSRSRSHGRRSRSNSRAKTSRRSRSKEKSRKSKKYKARSHSRERSLPKKKVQSAFTSVKKQKDPCEDIPGFSDMTPAQQSRLRVQAAFQAIDAKSSSDSQVKNKTAGDTALDQMERAQVIADIEDDGFLPMYFSSTRSKKTNEVPETAAPSYPTTLGEQEDFHEMAIFGNSSAIGLDEKTRKQISEATDKVKSTSISWTNMDPKSLAHPDLHIRKEVADRRWLAKLDEMRKSAQSVS